jgi:hypothetical protein
MLGLGLGHRDLYMTRGGAVNGPHLPKPMIMWASPKRPGPSALFPFFFFFSQSEQIVFLNLKKIQNSNKF